MFRNNIHHINGHFVIAEATTNQPQHPIGT